MDLVHTFPLPFPVNLLPPSGAFRSHGPIISDIEAGVFFSKSSSEESSSGLPAGCCGTFCGPEWSEKELVGGVNGNGHSVNAS